MRACPASAFVLGATLPLRRRRLGRRQVGVDVLVDAPGQVHIGRVQLEPARPRPANHERRAADVGQAVHRLARRQAVRDLDDGALGIAVQQQVGLAVDEDRAPHLVLPVVVVRDAAQAGLDAADDHRHVAPGLLAALRVDQRRAVGAAAAGAAGRVGVVAADLAVGGVAVDHRIHVAGGDAEEQVRLAQRLEGLGRLPVGLRDDADAEALRLEHAADHGHAEAGVVDVGVAGDDDDVAAVPAERVHLLPAHGQEGCGAETLGPERAPTRDRLGGCGGRHRVGGARRRGGCDRHGGSGPARPALCRAGRRSADCRCSAAAVARQGASPLKWPGALPIPRAWKASSP